MKFKCYLCEFIGNADEMLKHFGQLYEDWKVGVNAHPGKKPPQWAYAPEPDFDEEGIPE